jgi:hypothetical protein
MTEHREPLLIVVVAATVLVFGVLIGFGSNIADRFFGPDEAKIRQQCIERVHAEKDACLNGGAFNGVFKTSKRIKTCDEIYRRDLETCG